VKRIGVAETLKIPDFHVPLLVAAAGEEVCPMAMGRAIDFHQKFTRAW
jgi:hypothetical protein